jgi:hypothetical protein
MYIVVEFSKKWECISKNLGFKNGVPNEVSSEGDLRRVACIELQL